MSQIDDLSYKVLTDIIDPLDKKGELYIKDMYHFKELQVEVEFEENDIIGSLDIVGIFPNVPVRSRWR